MASGVAALCTVGDQGISALTEAYEQMDSLPQRSLILGNLMANMKADQEQIQVPFMVDVLKRESDIAINLHILEILVRFQVATNDEELTECLMAIPTEDTIDHTEGNEFLGSMSSCLALGNFAAHGNPLALTALQNFSKEGNDTVRGKISIRILEWLNKMQNKYQSSEIPHQDIINGLMNLRQNP